MGSLPRPAEKAVTAMFTLHQFTIAQMYVEERVAKAAQDHLVEQAMKARRATRTKVALKARLGRTLVSVGQRLETAGAA